MTNSQSPDSCRLPKCGSATPLVWVIVMAMSSLGSPTSAQVTINEATRSPDETATLFLRSVRAIRWGTVAQFLDAEALERFQFTVTMIANADSSGELREYLVQSDSTGMSDLSAFEVFERSINAVIDDMPGLMHALYDRDDSVIGSVREEGGVAHTVYRTLARISGAVPEVKVMQLRSTPKGWRVAWSDELEVIEAALRGVGR